MALFETLLYKITIVVLLFPPRLAFDSITVLTNQHYNKNTTSTLLIVGADYRLTRAALMSDTEHKT